jgi:DNA-binding transcriptional LysR family regulator
MAGFTLLGFEVIRAVAARGSFSAAAEALGYTQSAVSRQVAAMEVAAGAPLFERRARGVRPTSAGTALLRHAITALEAADAARRELADGTGARLRVGAFPTAVAGLVPRAAATFGAHHPTVELSLREGTTPSQIRRLRSGSVDAAVVTEPPDPTGTRLEWLLDDPLLLAVAHSHRLAHVRTVDVADLADEDWISGGGDPLLGVWPGVPQPARVAFVARDWTAKLGLVAAGLGVTVVPSLAAAAVRADVALIGVRAERPPARSVYVATLADREPSALVRRFADALHDAARG